MTCLQKYPLVEEKTPIKNGQMSDRKDIFQLLETGSLLPYTSSTIKSAQTNLWTDFLWLVLAKYSAGH